MIGYKIVRHEGGILASYNVQVKEENFNCGLSRKYEIGIPTRPMKGCGPLTLFKTLGDAKLFYDNNLKEPYDITFLCSYKPSKSVYVWSKHNYYTGKINVRKTFAIKGIENTIFATEITLLKEVSLLPEINDLKGENKTMKVIYQKMITRGDLRANPKVIYLFGDNLEQVGMGGQAGQMRGEPNAIGVPTKKNCFGTEDDYFTDEEYDLNVAAIEVVFGQIPPNSTIVIPLDGLGTGLAKLPTKAPKTFNYLQRRLRELED